MRTVRSLYLLRRIGAGLLFLFAGTVSLSACGSQVAVRSYGTTRPTLGYFRPSAETTAIKSWGLGVVEPAEIYTGGDGFGVVTRIRWATWGESIATGTARAWLLCASALTLGDGHWATARVVAFDSISCSGHATYGAYE